MSHADGRDLYPWWMFRDGSDVPLTPSDIPTELVRVRGSFSCPDCSEGLRHRVVDGRAPIGALECSGCLAWFDEPPPGGRYVKVER